MSDAVRVTVVVENTARGPGVLGEHGLAYWIEAAGRRVLFDTGQGGTLALNAQRLGVSLGQLDALVLSHGHYDHTGGIADALRGDRAAPIYAHPAAFAPKFARLENGSSREIGMPPAAQEAIRERGDRLVYTEQPTAVVDGLVATGPVPRTSGFEDTGGPFFLDRACQAPDPLVDDQALFFQAAEGTVVLLGCAHSGVINTLRHVRTLTGDRPLWTVIGGMHLGGASTERLERTVEELRRLEVRFLAPAHCTGMPATVALWSAFPGRCLACHAGARFEFAPAAQASSF